jgi:hypothetical protein
MQCQRSPKNAKCKMQSGYGQGGSLSLAFPQPKRFLDDIWNVRRRHHLRYRTLLEACRNGANWSIELLMELQSRWYQDEETNNTGRLAVNPLQFYLIFFAKSKQQTQLT